MDDIAPELLKKIRQEFEKLYNNDKETRRLLGLIQLNKADYTQTHEYAVRCGELLAQALTVNISSDQLPDGRMYYNIASKILNPVLTNGFEIVSDYSSKVQKNLNEQANIGLQVQKAELNQDRIDKLVQKISNAKSYDDASWLLQDPVVNFHQSVVDSSIKANAELHKKAGLSPKIVRKSVGGCCAWCKALEGLYDYSPSMDRNVFRRHENCRCQVLYDPNNGKDKYQDVYSKEWIDSPKPAVPVFQEATSIKQAEKYASDVLGIPTVNYTGLDLRVVNEMNAAATDLFNFCPDAKQYLNSYGSGQKINAAVKKVLQKQYYDSLIQQGYSSATADQYAKRFAKKDVGTIKATTLAQARKVWNPAKDRYGIKDIYNKAAGVTVNDKYGKDYSYFTQQTAHCEKIKFHPVGCGTVRSVFDHEFGHILDYCYDLSNDKDVIAAWNKASEAGMKEAVSQYANTNIAEFIAECYSEYCNNPNPREAAATIGDIINRKVKK